ncbi:23S rRNA (adenine(1618)-N(6))-methyltransferase RlmF [Mangrovibacterium marinum]|uniref:Ribosomal RNA large subunit methyltransferase F n=1 Tax=Mangrovibacterium marinum TaxID=1639118 RepID=A0A2T5BZ87_9BACT|nr:23S rRNA (adenine(1618)-N(6))-methyltransferase RlmF [Mangrovibacterium marinum]PTN07586.1 23S rRNA m(6)A-1618 methyltransferase [Mangrovibacterium marinum]
MTDKKKIRPTVKTQLHPRNKNRGRYNFSNLSAVCPELKAFVRLNPHGDESIDFANAQAVKTLNQAILKADYGLNFWDIPANYLCPPIPGRADYIHYLADLLTEANNGLAPTGNKINCLDIGVGANCIYPVIGCMEYGWNFVGADIDATALRSAEKIVQLNEALSHKIVIRHQANSKNIFKQIILPGEQFDLSLCNPPFHASAAQAAAGTLRKTRNLRQKRNVVPSLNFGGQSNELWCDGGEEAFLKRMIWQSKDYAHSCFWFTSLVSKSERLPTIYRILKKVDASQVKTSTMRQGNKVSRFVAWTFLSDHEQKQWTNRWK